MKQSVGLSRPGFNEKSTNTNPLGVTGHWKEYQSYIATLRIHQPNPLSSSNVSAVSQAALLRLFLAEDSAQAWDNSSSNGTIRLVLSPHMGFEEFCDSFASHVTATGMANVNIVLRLESDHPRLLPATIPQLLASLCLQLLEQQPSLVLWIRHLYPNLRDAILGSDGLWMSRVLTRLLRTILLTPRRGITYCLLHASNDSRLDIITLILEIMKISEIPLRLLVSTHTNTNTGLGVVDTSPCVDLSSSGGKTQIHEQKKNNLSGVFDNRLTELWAALVVARGDKMDRSAETPSAETNSPLRSDSDHISTLSQQTLTRCVENGMTWALHAMAWISFAIRPLSRVETQEVLEVLCADERSIPAEMQDGEVLLRTLELALPGLLFITEEAVWAPPQLGARLSGMWATHISCSPNPKVYLARRCFTLAVDFLQKCPTPTPMRLECESKTEDHDGTPETANAKTLKNHELIVRYAVRYWIEHHLRGTRPAGTTKDDFRKTLEQNPLFEPKAWIQYLTALYWSPNIADNVRDTMQPGFLRKAFDLDLFDACYLSFRMSTLPLMVSDNSDWLLLGIASRSLAEDAYFNMVLKIREKLSASTLCRVFAAAPSTLLARFVSEPDSHDFLRTGSVEILLTAIAIGNTSVTTNLLEMGIDTTLGHKQEDVGTSSLGTALQVACEYNNLGVVEKILSISGDLSPFSLEESYPWNALHVACHQGHENLVKLLNGRKELKPTLRKGPPSQLNPLLITSARGLFATTKALEPLVLGSPADEEDHMSPLQLACKYGFLETLETLLDTHNLSVPRKKYDNHAVFLALQSGNDRVGTRIYAAWLHSAVDAIADAQESGRPNDSDDNHEEDEIIGSTSDSHEEDSIVEEAEEMIGKALFTALHSADVFDSFHSIRINLKDPARIKDFKGRTLSMVAVLIDSAYYCEEFHIKGEELTDFNKKTTMHYACQYGRLDIVKFLLAQDDQDSLTAQDDQSATPITQAAMGGHHKIVELLLPRLSIDSLKSEFILAAKNGLERTLSLIFKVVTDLESTAREECVNATDEQGNTPLHHAAGSNHSRVVQFLLLHRAKVDASNKGDMTPLALASESSSLDSMRLLLDAGAQAEIRIRRERTVLTQAMFYEIEAPVELLLEYGALPRLCDCWSYYNSLLEWTLFCSSTGVLKILLKYFDKWNKRASGGPLPEGIFTPEESLRIIIKAGLLDNFNAALELWPNLDPTLIEGKYKYEIGSMFKYAAAYGSFKILRRIWDRSEGRIDVNEFGGYHGTALQAALVSDTSATDKARALIDWGAKIVPQTDEDGETPIPAPLDKEWLYSCWGTALHAATSSSDPDNVTLILEKRNSLRDQPDLMGRLPLHLATISDNWNIAQQLTSDKTTITSEDYQGRNALHMACGVGSDSFVVELLKDDDLAASLINKPDVDGWTPLHWACRSRSREIVQILLDKGADKAKRAVRPAAWLPYHVAAYHGWTDLHELKVEDYDSEDVEKPTEAGQNTYGSCNCCCCVSFATLIVAWAYLSGYLLHAHAC